MIIKAIKHFGSHSHGVDPLTQRFRYHAHEIPGWLVSHHIHAGYRYHVSFLDCARSIFYLHNETVSIWTHFVPSVIFAAMAFDFALRKRKHYDGMVFGKLCGSFSAVFGASAFMHTFNPINEDWFYQTLGLDWGAIALATLGGGSTLATLGFHNNPQRQYLWQLAFGVSCTLFASIASCSSFHTMPHTAKTLLVLFPVSAMIGFVCDLRKCLPPKEMAKVKQVITGPAWLTLVGVLVYAAEFPEAQFTDINFDISRGHHLFHHLWSTVFAFWFLRNTLEWAKDIYSREKHL